MLLWIRSMDEERGKRGIKFQAGNIIDTEGRIFSKLELLNK